MKKVLVYLGDLNPRKNSSWGIFNVSVKILETIHSSMNHELILVVTNKNQELFSKISCKKILLNEKRGNLNKIVRDNFEINNVIHSIKPEIAFFPRGFIPLIKVKGVKYFSFIHDLIPLYYLKKGKFKFFFSVLRLLHSAKFSDHIFTNSEYSKVQIKRHSKKKIVSLPLGVQSVRFKKQGTVKEPFVFIIGNKNPHKNLEFSKEVIINYNKKNKTNFKTFCSTGKYSSEEIAGYYKNARFSLFLSDIEGFGLPLIESYAYGTPVVFNNQTSLAEIGKDLPGKCDIKDLDSIFNAIKECLNLSNEKIKHSKIKLLKKYNWNNFNKLLLLNLK